MKKYTFLVFHREYSDFLKKLGKLGIVHVNDRFSVVEKESLIEKNLALDRYDRLISLLKKTGKAENNDTIPLSDQPDDIILKVEKLEESRSQLEKNLVEIQKNIDRILPWGDIDHGDFEKLAASGYRIRLFRCRKQQFDPSWQEKYYLFIINSTGVNICFLVMEIPEDPVYIDAEEETLLEQSLSELLKERSETESLLKETLDKISRLAETSIRLLTKGRLHLQGEIAIQKIYLETLNASKDSLMVLEGWVPDDSEKKLLELLEKEKIIGLVTMPDSGELPPVLLKNSRFSKLFEPISNLFDLPSYNEMDLTPYFAPFFVLFFGFCLGDAGYGVFFILFATLLKLKSRKEFRPILTLTQYFGLATIVFGLLSGTFFGINLIDTGYTLTSESFENMIAKDVPQGIIAGMNELNGVYFKGRAEFLVAVEQSLGTESFNTYKITVMKHAESGIPFFSSFRHLMQDSLNMFYLSIIIGGMQILFGIVIRIFNITKKKGLSHAYSTIGWVILIISLLLYYFGLFGGVFLTWLFYGLLGFSGILILIMNNPDKGILARIGSGIWDSYGMVIGLFGDILSYIRLFALGISSAILGFVFNDIALQLLSIPYIGWLFFLLLLLVGHTINLLLATLGGLIHPMRLTFVEFYKNAGFAGGGKKYKPFIIHH